MILVPAALLWRIEVAAQAAYPEECCGLLIGFREPAGRVRAVSYTHLTLPTTPYV